MPATALATRLPPPDDEPSDKMLVAWASRPVMQGWQVLGYHPTQIDAETALLRLRAVWDGLKIRREALAVINKGEHVKSSDAPWWCYDPRTDRVHRVRYPT